MTTKKLSRRQTCWAKFLSRSNFDISYTLDRENEKTNSLTCGPNDGPADNSNYGQQHLLKPIFLLERLEISSINPDESETTPQKVIWAKLADSYHIKVRKTISPHFFIKGINTCQVSNIFIDSKGCIRQFNHLWVLDHLQLMVIKEIQDQIAMCHPGYQKTVSFITQNYYGPELKKLIERYIHYCHFSKHAKAPKN